MNIDSKTIISVTAANQNFSKVVKMVEENGQAVIFKRNKPRYMMIDIDNIEIAEKAYEQLKDWQKENKGQKR
ncbi:MAG: type II toxin-antitoxin system Phd/YefM family antitoxin [Lachnospiraceae bacterium]|nr:type II toxin-antitoxin system Phd/YefM family antitoxin [Candidatus Darwinimomas equi]